MATIEQVEKLREKANVTYDEAKNALDASGGDILDAIIYLERQGKVIPPQNGGYYQSGCKSKEEEKDTGSTGNNSQSGQSFSQLAGRFFRWCGKMIAIGNVNSLEVSRQNNVVISIPVTVLVLLLIFAFWIVIPLFVIGLFFGCRYVFKGQNLEKTGVNNIMNSAADAAESFKNEVKGNHENK